ncbi:TPA: hypothetical protein U2J78_005050, partial [Serratia marcescens]|nr:hypothetical protein [Serratia marcescens]
MFTLLKKYLPPVFGVSSAILGLISVSLWSLSSSNIIGVYEVLNSWAAYAGMAAGICAIAIIPSTYFSSIYDKNNIDEVKKDIDDLKKDINDLKKQNEKFQGSNSNNLLKIENKKTNLDIKKQLNKGKKEKRKKKKEKRKKKKEKRNYIKIRILIFRKTNVYGWFLSINCGGQLVSTTKNPRHPPARLCFIPRCPCPALLL